MREPYILEETENYAVVFKPAKMHSRDKRNFTTNQHESESSVLEKTLLEWYTEHSSHVFDIMHRLDYETNGLVLFAKNEKSFLFFKDLQDRGEFIKEYSAICSFQEGECSLPGFPPCPPWLNCFPSVIQSYFRPFGPGRKQVRPVIEDGKKHKEIAKDKGGFYTTEIMEKNENGFTVRIKRGFRHQIRCHLCWAGFPILNDPLYSLAGESPQEGELALRSHALFFIDPASGELRECRISSLK